ncbi:MAG: hypothetical protein QW331_00375 [Candidatus Woesearchaeota archaeon]
MAKKEVIDYIKQYSSQYSREDLAKALRRDGVSEEDIIDAFRKAEKKVTVSLWTLIFVAVALALTFGVVYYFVYGFDFLMPTTKVCTTKECFVSMANRCDLTVYSVTEEGTTYVHTIKKGCIYSKTVTKVAPTEPQDVKILLEGKSFECKYYQNAFNNAWMNTLTQGLQNCHGELREGLQELMLIQYRQLVAELRQK